jgi:ribosomal protein S18 acetylase RimI-like enzyme
MYLPKRRSGFAESRRAYILVHLDPRNTHVDELPGNTVLRQAFPPDAAHWTHIVNEAFGGWPGRPDMDLDRARELLGRRRVLRDGTLIAWRDDAPAGVVMSVIDEDDHTMGEIETLAVVPSDQGIGLGRALLRSALVAIAREGLTTAELSVATDNRRALALYFDAGFTMRDVRVCWERAR